MAAPRDARTRLAKALVGAVEAVAPGHAPETVLLERPKLAAHGDYACNVAMQLAKALKRPPREIAARLVAAIADTPELDRAEIAGAGFINLFLKPAYKQQVVNRILATGDPYGRVTPDPERKVQVEFVSANPTGPLHVGHGRQAALGDAIAALLEAQGYSVTREFYYNDAGAQIDKLALSVQARARGIKPGEAGWPEEGYNGEYIEDIAREYRAGNGAAEDLEAIRRFAVAYLRAEQDADLAGVRREIRRLLPGVEPLHRGQGGRRGQRRSLRAARPTRRTARCGCAPPITATTRIASCASPTAPTPTSCRTSPTTSPSGSAAFAR